MTEKNKKDDYFEKQNPSILKSLGGLITFSTIIPLNVHTSIEEMAKLTWFWPIIGTFVGFIGLLIGYLFLNVLMLPSLIVATIVYSFFLIFNGFHHLDGLIDIGDALMVHGSPEKKIAIMRDFTIGTGGIALFFITGILTTSILSSILAINLITAILICEMSAKLGLITCCVTSISGEDGTGKYFIESMNIPKFISSIILTGSIAYLFAGFIGVFGILGGILGGALISYIGAKNFKIATGDVLGASNEIGRVFSLLAIIISFKLFLFI